MFRLILLALVMTLPGCAAKYSCGQFPTSGCQPVSTVYQRSENGFHDYRKTLFTKKESEGQRRDANINVGRAHQAINYASPGDPILTKPVVLRVLLNSWVDEDKDLNAGNYIYLRVRDSEWVQQNN